MYYEEVHAVEIISPYLHQANISIAGVVSNIKKHMVSNLLEAYPSDEYCQIRFDVDKPNSVELGMLVESCRMLDGRYRYGIDFVSREWLEKVLAQKDYKVSMSAIVRKYTGATDEKAET